MNFLKPNTPSRQEQARLIAADTALVTEEDNFKRSEFSLSKGSQARDEDQRCLVDEERQLVAEACSSGRIETPLEDGK
jgi:hypothetical protein